MCNVTLCPSKLAFPLYSNLLIYTCAIKWKYCGLVLCLVTSYAHFPQVFNKLLSLASTASSQKYQSHMWSQMLLSTHAFLKSISNVSGKDIGPLIKQWVYPFICFVSLTLQLSTVSLTRQISKLQTS